MGFTPEQVDRMSIAEFNACTTGWQDAHGGGGKPPADPMSPERMRDLGLL